VAREATSPSMSLFGGRASSPSRDYRKKEQSKDTIEQVILRRGSTRTFDKAAANHAGASFCDSRPRHARDFRLIFLGLPAGSSTIFT